LVITMGDDIKEHDIVLEPNTVLLAENMVGWLDMMYRTLPLKDGESLTVPVIFPGDFGIDNLVIDVRLEEPVVEGETVTIYVCTVPALGEIHYVSKSGRLLTVQIPEKNVTIELADVSSYS